MTCEMDSLQCQKIRKLTSLYHQLKAPATASTKIDRIEFLSQLHAVLMELDSQSPILDEVMNGEKMRKSLSFNYFFVFSCSICWIENKNYCSLALIRKPLSHADVVKMNCFEILLHHKKYSGQSRNLKVSHNVIVNDNTRTYDHGRIIFFHRLIQDIHTMYDYKFQVLQTKTTIKIT